MTGALLASLGGGLALWYARERRLRHTHAMDGGLHADITLPHEAEFELYHNDFSLCSKKVRMCLAELGIAYASRPIDLIETGRYETLGRDFLRVNPAALVPVLVHHGHPVYESHEILHYAAAHAGTPDALVPADGEARARMQRWIERSSLTGDDPTAALEASAGNCVPGLTVPLFAAMIRDIPVHRILEGLLFHRLKRRPLTFLVLRAAGLSRIAALPPVRRVIAASFEQMGRHLDELERDLAERGGPWLTGAQFTLADVSLAVIFERLREADWVEELLGPRPEVSRYVERLRRRPSWESAMARHEHPLVRAGTARIRAEKTRNEAFRRVIYAAPETSREPGSRSRR